jgi:hypothetical protein
MYSYVGLPVNYLLFLSDFTKTKIRQHVGFKSQMCKFMTIFSVRVELFYARRRGTDKTELPVAIRNLIFECACKPSGLDRLHWLIQVALIDSGCIDWFRLHWLIQVALIDSGYIDWFRLHWLIQVALIDSGCIDWFRLHWFFFCLILICKLMCCDILAWSTLKCKILLRI